MIDLLKVRSVVRLLSKTQNCLKMQESRTPSPYPYSSHFFHRSQNSCGDTVTSFSTPHRTCTVTSKQLGVEIAIIQATVGTRGDSSSICWATTGTKTSTLATTTGQCTVSLTAGDS